MIGPWKAKRGNEFEFDGLRYEDGRIALLRLKLEKFRTIDGLAGVVHARTTILAKQA